MAEKEIKEENSFAEWFLPQIIYMVVSAGICFLVFWLSNKSIGFFIQSIIVSLFMCCLTGIAVRGFFPVSISVYADNRKRLSDFWITYGCGLALSAACILMPDAVWPFMGIFVILGAYGGALAGSVGGASLLIMAVLLTGENIGVMIIYLSCGILAVILVSQYKKNSKPILPALVSLAVLFAMISFGIIISAPDSVSAISFILPLVNVILSGIIMFAGLRIFYNRNIAVTDDKYAILNDTSYPVLSKEKENDYNSYMIAIHTSYFCERISQKLGLDDRAMKCAGLYYRFCPAGDLNRENFLKENDFPQKAALILTEYTDFISKRSKGKVFSKECVVLVCAQMVVVTTFAMHSKNADLKIGDHIDKIVDATFDRYMQAETFASSDITFKELETVKNLFKGEKLYYDFLCGK